MELIKIHNKNGNQVVSARELHNFLECKRDFSNWIKDRIEKYGFIENQDFEVFNNFGENPNGGRPLKEYALTIDTAKEIAMVEGNEKGKQARRYFIECEKKLKEVNTPQFNIPQTYPEALKLAYEQSVQIEQQKKVINTQQHYVNFAERCFDENLEDVSSISETAKKLDLPYGSKTLYKVLRFYGMLTKNNKDRNEPKQEFVNRGYFLLKQTSYENKEGKQFINNVVYVTQKGLAYLTARRNKLVCPIMLDIVNKNAA